MLPISGMLTKYLGNPDYDLVNSFDVTTVVQTEEQVVAATVKEPVIYTVKSGDTIMGICKKYYGDTSKCKEVTAYNDIKDENVLYIGQQIKLP